MPWQAQLNKKKNLQTVENYHPPKNVSHSDTPTATGRREVGGGRSKGLFEGVMLA